MKVLLIYPPRSTKVLGMAEDKLGLLYMAAVLRQNGVDTRIYDECEHSTFKGLAHAIREYKPTIVGISISTPNRFDGFKTAKLAKGINKKTLVIAGGPHISSAAVDTLENVKEIDVAAIGEGENTLLDICKIGPDVRGVALKKNGRIVVNPPRERIEDLNGIPFPARDLLRRYKEKNIDKYHFNLDMPDESLAEYYSTTLITTRGCPFNCTFCAAPEIWGKGVRLRSAENVIAELMHLKEAFNVDHFRFCDDTFNINKERVFKICNLILKEKASVKWHCHLRADNVDKEMLSIMKEAGCYMISFGIESGSQYVLDNIIEKRINLARARKILKWCDEVGIKRTCNFIYSLPDESREDVEKTLDFMKEIGGTQAFGPTIILPGSRIEKIAKKKGLFPANFSWAKITPYKYHDPTSNSFLPIFVDKLSWEEILGIFYGYVISQSKTRTRNYIFRIIYRLFQIRSIAEFKFVIKNYFEFLKILLKPRERR